MAYRIYIDESCTHEGSDWLLIGMLFVPQHGLLHNALVAAKEAEKYYSQRPDQNATYKEFHFADVKSARDVRVGKLWIDAFVTHPGHFRCLAFEWSMWDGSNFGNAFEPDTLKKRRAYKKWCELLLQPELSTPLDGGPIRGAELYLDRLRMAYGYDVIDHLQDRFEPSPGFRGHTPYITKFQHTASWRDANQCLQLTDLLLGCLKQEFMPSARSEKDELRRYLAERLEPYGIKHLGLGFWRQWHHSTLREKLPKFSAWCWKPERKR